MTEVKKQRKQAEMPSAKQRLPVSIITGFLGSGKTTLLNHILSTKDHKMKIAVVNNDFSASKFGVIGVANEMKVMPKNTGIVADVYEAQGGCVCCGGGQDFQKILKQFIPHKSKIDYVLIETTGMADPSFANCFLMDPVLKAHFYLDSILCVVDATTTPGRLEEARQFKRDDGTVIINECVEQLIVADRIVVNKTDLTTPKELKLLEEKIKTLNNMAPIVRTSYSKVDLKWILDVKSFNIENTLKKDAGFLNVRPNRQHDPSIRSFCVVGGGSMDLKKFEKWIQEVLSWPTHQIYRAKGVIAVRNDPRKFVFQAVRGKLLDVSPRGEWDDKKEPKDKRNRMVFIGRKILTKCIFKSFDSTVNGFDEKDPERVKLVDADAPPGMTWGAMLFLLLFIAIICYRMFFNPLQPSDAAPNDTDAAPNDNGTSWKLFLISIGLFLMTAMPTLYSIIKQKLDRKQDRKQK